MNRTTFSFARLSLTPALSRWERENRRQMAWNGERSERFRGSMRDVLRGNLTPFLSRWARENCPPTVGMTNDDSGS
jgi:hypothetical protein